MLATTALEHAVDLVQALAWPLAIVAVAVLPAPSA
jgi:hypothetical protein